MAVCTQQLKVGEIGRAAVDVINFRTGLPAALTTTVVSDLHLNSSLGGKRAAKRAIATGEDEGIANPDSLLHIGLLDAPIAEHPPLVADRLCDLGTPR